MVDFVFSPQQRDMIEWYRSQGLYAAGYRYAADLAKGGEGVDPKSISWMYGAAQVNEGTGFYSQFIRGYGAGDVNDFLSAAYGGVASVVQAFNGSIILDTRNHDNSGLSGTSAGDYMHGGDGNDTLLSSLGNDIMDGGDGIDTADFSASAEALSVTVKAVASTAMTGSCFV